MVKKLAGFTIALGACSPAPTKPPAVWVVEVDAAVAARVDLYLVTDALDDYFEGMGVLVFAEAELVPEHLQDPRGFGVALFADSARYKRTGEGLGISLAPDQAIVWADRFADELDGPQMVLALSRVMAHEIGHCYGLPHREDSPVMECCNLPYLAPTSEGFLPEEVDAVLEVLR